MVLWASNSLDARPHANLAVRQLYGTIAESQGGGATVGGAMAGDFARHHAVSLFSIDLSYRNLWQLLMQFGRRG